MHEIVEVGVAAVAEKWVLLVALVAGTAIALVGERILRERLPRPVRASLHGLALAAGLGAGLWLARKVLFLCDDAFISFRYARNLAEGHGLVFNVGEWVEGYTNFLWTALLGGLGWLGIDIPLAALFGCLASYVGAVLLTAAAVRRASPGPTLIPFAAIALAASAPFTTFASSGLETMPGALLVVLAMWLTTTRASAWLPGLAMTGAALMRPDHMLFWGCMGLALVGEDLLHRRGLPLLRRLDFKRYLAYGAPFVLIYVPYFLIRWKAYGDFFPNTYYVKSGHLTYWSQGLVYATHFVASTGAWAWIPAFLWALWGRARAPSETRLRLFAILAVPLFARYVIKVGGDFMEYRFFVPLLPIVAVAAEASLRWRLAETRALWVKGMSMGLAALGVAAALLPVRLIPPGVQRWHLAMEPSFYPVVSVFPLEIGSPYFRDGHRLAETLADRGILPPIATGCVGMLGYYSRLPVIDALGLVNREVAHMPIQRRGRPGHEKQATREEMIDMGAVIDFAAKWGEEWRRQTEVRVGNLVFHFVRFDPVFAEAIAAIPGATIPRPETDVEELVRDAPRERLVEATRFYSKFLEGNPLREKLLDRLDSRLNAVADFETELPPGAIVKGRGFGVHRSCPVGRVSGRGCLRSQKNGTGEVRIPLRLRGNELRFLLAGDSSELLSARLEAGAETVFRATPRGAGAFEPFVWDVAALAGREATLVLQDDDPEGLLAVDAVHFPAEEGDLRQRLAAAPAGAIGTLLVEAESTLPPGDPDLVSIQERIVARWTLDDLPAGAEVTGKAFGDGPVAAALPGQTSVRGWRGRGYLNSFHGGDGAVGQVSLPAFVIGEEPISLLVGGGADCTKVYVGLEIGGRVVTRACGMNDEQLRPAALKVRRWAGKEGRIVLVDESTGGWGHLLVDDVIVTGSGTRLVKGKAE